ncbi:MAG: hypothetical protein BJG00_016975 [Limnothrix sp. CACIAM 69d]|nr:MAG: hypothetical protein BJG00_016975 [Limnothrix sp. CACIAM 69d]
MAEIEILRSMIHEHLLVPCQPQNIQYGRHCYQVELTERQKQGGAMQKLYALTVTNCPEKTLVIRADQFWDRRKLFQGIRGEQRCADYILICDDAAIGQWILYIELKKSDADLKSIKQQILGAQCILRYCTAIGQRFWNQPNFLSTYKRKNIGIAKINLAKRKTRLHHRPVLKFDQYPCNDHHVVDLIALHADQVRLEALILGQG